MNPQDWQARTVRELLASAKPDGALPGEKSKGLWRIDRDD